MAKLVYAMNQSLDGYVDHMKMGPPSPEAFRHFVDFTLGLSGLLYGRNLYEIMRYWDNDLPDWDADQRAFATVWRNQPKWIVSHSQPSVGPNATLLTEDPIEAIRKLKTDRDGEIGVGGPNLANSLTAAGLIDEYRIYLRPVVLGSGVPFFAGPCPPLRLTATDHISGDILRLTYVPT